MSRTFRRLRALHLADGLPCLPFTPATASCPEERRRRAHFHSDAGHRRLHFRYDSIEFSRSPRPRTQVRDALIRCRFDSYAEPNWPVAPNRNRAWDFS